MSKKRVKISRTNVDVNNMKKGIVVINSNEKEISKNNERSMIISSTNRDKVHQINNISFEDLLEPNSRVNLINET
ncbi:15452_t:CDS:1, partial [Gigaspora margarita]